MNVLVVGGAGYIGAQMTKALATSGHKVVVFDNLSTGHAGAVRYGRLVIGDMAETAVLNELFLGTRFDLVMHFAAASLVGESVEKPAKYYRNNVAYTLNLIDAMVRHDVLRLIFSSTAAIFGAPEYTPVDEAHPKGPISPYGDSKLMVERVLDACDRAYGVKSICLRYFNAAGADPDGELGECHNPETHLIPLVLQVASGQRDFVTVFGSDYDTPDGTCIRDYIHVADLCDAHLLSAQRLMEGGSTAAYNLGNGDGFSVRQVIETARKVTGHPIPVRDGPRRPGDPSRLVADARLARAELGWQPRYPDLPTIIQHAWAWEARRGNEPDTIPVI